uniref:Uncharacterized protein n=1 Tax=Oryza barthii TaxID=65489 RepID=A0A0D3FSE0_9ORYZ
MSSCDNEKLEKGIVCGLVLTACAPRSGAEPRRVCCWDEVTTTEEEKNERVALYGGDDFQVREECLHKPTLGIAGGRKVGKKVVVSLPPPAMPSCASVVDLAMTLAVNREKRLRIEEADRWNKKRVK